MVDPLRRGDDPEEHRNSEDLLSGDGDTVDATNAQTPNYKGSVIIPGAGHWTQQEKAPEFNEALLGFLKSL